MARRNRKTEADKRFEAYLDDHNVCFAYEPPWAEDFGICLDDNPDYAMDPGGARAVCEVKQFESTRVMDRLAPLGLEAAAGISHKDEFLPIRSKVREAAREQLAPFKELAVPLVIVLANPAPTDVRLDDHEVTCALMGDPHLAIRFDPKLTADAQATPVAGEHGALRWVEEDGTEVNPYPFVSAVVVVHQSPHMGGADSYRWVHVYDVSGNPTPPGFSGTPLPRHILNGPHDHWWECTDGEFAEITTGR